MLPTFIIPQKNRIYVKDTSARKKRGKCLTSNVGYRFLSARPLIGPCGMIGDCLFPVVNPGQCRPQWPRSGAEFLTPMIHWRSQAEKKMLKFIYSEKASPFF